MVVHRHRGVARQARRRGQRIHQSPIREISGLLTRANTARPDLTTAAFFSWAALADHGAFGPAIGTRFALDGYAITWPTADKQVTEAAENHLANTGADLTFVYLGETDEVAHDLGPHCPDYTEALHTQDAYLGRFLDAIRGRPTFAGERWTVLVTTDHGHVDEGGHGGTSIEERTVFVIAARLGADLGGVNLGSATWAARTSAVPTWVARAVPT